MSSIPQKSEWTFDLLKHYEALISNLCKHYQLDTYPIQIEVISAEQMIEVYSTSGMPVSYNHWSFGKRYINTHKKYQQGHIGLAYEIVINSDPCIIYLLEENTLAMQVLVLAHAAYGHNAFFKGNYLFQDLTHADAIINYLVFAKKYIADCEEKYGEAAVESTLDCCHALMHHGIDRYRRHKKFSIQEEQEKHLQIQSPIIDEPEENLLYFIEKNSITLELWQRELVRITRKISQYFYPQRLTKLMNEGWATFWHYTLMHDLYDAHHVDDAFMLEFLHNHTNVIFQPSFDHEQYSGINPYNLGFAIFKDIRRICEDPTDEDRHWSPDIAGTPWQAALIFAMKNFKDDSFIAQYLSPKVIRDLKLFSVFNDEISTELTVSAIHNDVGYQNIRENLAKQYEQGSFDPNIQVVGVNQDTDNSLVLRYYQRQGRSLHEDRKEMLKYLHTLWGAPIQLETHAADNHISSVEHYPPPPDPSEEPSTKS